MGDLNVAYTAEYQKYRQKINEVFCEKFKKPGVEERALPDGRHFIKITQFNDESAVITGFRLFASITEVMNEQGKKLAEFKSAYHKDFFNIIKHQNGRSYLLFSIDLYGYSVLDLTDYRVWHYVPESSFSNNAETFIWTNVLYCPLNNTIAVDGCYWAAPYATEFFDFTIPEQLPFDRICTSYDMEDQFDTGADIIPIQWNADGSIQLEGFINEQSVIKNINVFRYAKQDEHKAGGTA